MSNLETFAACVALTLLAPIAATAGSPSFTYRAPKGLAPGSHYLLAFVTSDTIDGTSSDLSTYDNFVQAEAALSPSLPTTTWKAFVTTPDFGLHYNLYHNCSCGNYNTPIYVVTGQEVDPGLEALLYPTPNIQHPIDVTQNGEDIGGGDPVLVWTGTNIRLNNNSSEMGATTVFLGVADHTDYSFRSLAAGIATSQNHLYAVSDTLTVPPLPEPATWTLMVVGIGAMGASLRRGSRRSSSSVRGAV